MKSSCQIIRFFVYYSQINKKGDIPIKKTHHLLEILGNLFEIAIAILVAIAIVINIASLVLELGEISLSDTHIFFEHYLKNILEAVIGVEFLKMLLKPKPDTILEVLIFVVTRHMIVQTTSVYEDLIVIISVGILLVLKKVLKKDGFKLKKGDNAE